MSYRKTLKLLCGFAGGSAVLVFTAAAADSRGYLGEQRGEADTRWPRLSVLRAAQPAWTPAKHTPAPSGHAWDFNWDKYVPLHTMSTDTVSDPDGFCCVASDAPHSQAVKNH